MTRHFTSAKPPLTFTVDDDEFVVPSVLPAGKLAAFIGHLTKLNTDSNALTLDELVTTALNALETILTREQAEVLARRIQDTTHPLTLTTLVEVLTWLAEQWTGVAAEANPQLPTRPPSDSSTSEPTGGPTSTQPSPGSIPT